MSIDDVAKNAVVALKKALPFYPSFSTLRPTIDIEGDDQAIIQFEGDDMFILIEMRKEKLGITNKTHMVPRYTPGYYKQISGGRWNPPETEDVYLNNGEMHQDVISAFGALVQFDFVHQVSNMMECEAFAEDMAFIEENVDEIATAIKG
jgi:hypothetical protein